ncbi:hypothetical protein PWG15_33815 (plasmid) [Ensifer adhaerens]|uniref:hypothetical protein n=1 Tax=Ensifer adhaerens TaxID=106592 RepID=UPI0023A9BAAF|nr:hypothetical protein [Ensifer adhaerens]WDZ81880.1 hypothetical protein PWG15_33815 [Ensifer adhaerens]
MTGALKSHERKLVAILRASARLHFADADKADAEVERVLRFAISEAEQGRSRVDKKRWLLRMMHVPS